MSCLRNLWIIRRRLGIKCLHLSQRVTANFKWCETSIVAPKYQQTPVSSRDEILSTLRQNGILFEHCSFLQGPLCAWANWANGTCRAENERALSGRPRPRSAQLTKRRRFRHFNKTTSSNIFYTTFVFFLLHFLISWFFTWSTSTLAIRTRTRQRVLCRTA